MTIQDVARRSTTVERAPAGAGGRCAAQKLSIPRLPAIWVPRERLHRLLDAACERELLVVTSLPGGGKTAALASWAAGHTSRRVAWVSLSERDGTRERFWRNVVAAVRGSRPVVAPGGERRPTRREALAPVEAALGALEAVAPVTLVLDDFHVVRDEAVLREMGELLRQLPPGVSVAISGRSDPEIAVARLFAAEEVARVGYDDLRLRPQESEALLSGIARRPLAGEVVDRAVARTQGWPVAVRLAGLQLREATDTAAALEAITGGAAWIAPYVEEELVAGASGPLRHVLRQAALVDRLTPALCSAMSDEPCAATVLSQMAGDDGLLAGDPFRGYRLHPLVAEALRTRLRREEPEAYAALHGRAARYFEQAGDCPAAHRHLEAAGDREHALDVAAQEALALLRAGVVGGAPQWVGTLRAPSVLDSDGLPARALAGALASLVAGEPWEAARWLEESERAARGDDDATSGRSGRRRAVLAALVATLAGDVEAMREKAGAALAPEAARVPPDNSPETPGWLRSLDELTPPLASVLLARACLWLGDADVAARVAAEAARGLPDARFAVALDSVRAAATARLGHLGEAERLARTTLWSAEAHGLDVDRACLDAELALGWVHLERGEPQAAREHLDAALRSAATSGYRFLQVLTELEVVPVLLASGDLAPAFEVLARHRRGRDDASAPAVRARLDALELEWRLAAGDPAGATRALELLPPGRRTGVLEARVALLSGRPARALARLESVGLPSGATVPERIEHLAVAARAAHQAGALHRARDAMHRALELGRAEELVGPFLTGGHEGAWLLRSLQRGYPDPYLERLLSALGGSDGQEAAGEAVVALVEGLTEREREALLRLPTHLTQQQIAAELYVSVNTLKTHLKGLYRKLGATSRSEAVAAARLRGLV